MVSRLLALSVLCVANAAIQHNEQTSQLLHDDANGTTPADAKKTELRGTGNKTRTSMVATRQHALVVAQNGEGALELHKGRKALPWTSTTVGSAKSLAPVVDGAVNVLNMGSSNIASTAHVSEEKKKIVASGGGPEVVAKYTASAEASAQRAHVHLEAAKAALEKTVQNAQTIHETGHKVEKTANTIGYLYSTPEPVAPATKTTTPAPTTAAPVKSGVAKLSVFGSMMIGAFVCFA